MAIEGVVANAGAGGAEFAVDQVSGGSGTVDVPYVKLMSGADASANLIPGTAANGLLVDVSRVTGTVTVDGSGVTQPVSVASIPSHAVTNAGTFAVQAAESDGANVTLGAKADAKSTATDTTAVTAMSVLKQISASVQAPPSQAVTNAGTFAVQAAEADGACVTLGAKADAKSTATDTTAVTAMSVLKQISASVQAPPSQAVTNAGTFAVQSAVALGAEVDGASVTLGAKADAKSTATDTTAVTAMSVLKQISASVQAPPSQAVTNAGTFAVQSAIADGANVTLGAKADAKSAATDTTAITVMSVLKQISASVQAPPLSATKSLKTVSGTLTADTDVIAAVGSKRLKVYAYSIFSVGTNANAAIFKSNGTGGTELWRFLLQGATGVPAGMNLAVSPPNFLFATVAGEKLTLDVSNADTLHYSIAYFDDDAT